MLVSRCADGIRGMFERCTDHVPGGRRTTVDGVALVATGLPYPPCNQALALTPVTDPVATIAGIEGFFGELPFTVQTWRDAIPAAALEQAGFRSVFHSPLMVYEGDPPVVPAIDGIDLVSLTPDLLPDAIESASTSFQLPLDGASAFMGRWMLDDPTIEQVVALDGDVVVGTALGHTEGGLTGIFNISTLDAYRNRGIGAALTAAVMRAPMSFLQASPMGEPVYRRLGFTVAGIFDGWSRV